MAELKVKDAEYLQEYLKICEKFVYGGINNEEANKQVESLNRKFRKLSEGIKRGYVIADNMVQNFDGWFPSDIC